MVALFFPLWRGGRREGCLFIFAPSKSCESQFDLQPVPGESGDPNERAANTGN